LAAVRAADVAELDYRNWEGGPARFPEETVPSTPEARYAVVVEALLGNSNVTQAADVAGSRRGMFGSSGQLRTSNRIFAMLVRGKLVVKLPRQRVDMLVASGEGERFDPGHGRLMKEWFTLAPASEVGWLSLAREALEFVASKR
jgi:TfoX/Sxy family transcriptional regulator of competence genes